MIKKYSKFSFVLSQNANFFANFFGENILNIITSVLSFLFVKIITFFKRETNTQNLGYFCNYPKPGANPTIVIYNASLVKSYNATNSIARF
jgi:hypothetical protein